MDRIRVHLYPPFKFASHSRNMGLLSTTTTVIGMVAVPAGGRYVEIIVVLYSLYT